MKERLYSKEELIDAMDLWSSRWIKNPELFQNDSEFRESVTSDGKHDATSRVNYLISIINEK